ncbi:hypothetical protein D3C72_1951690 [compost metagenome]
MVIASVAVGKAAAVREELTEKVLPIFREAEGFVHGAFDMLSGRLLPALVCFVTWPSLAHRERAMAAFDARMGQRRTAGLPRLFDRLDQYLMHPVAVDWART